ncbi:shieldin complex subunit 1 isoform X2 [Rhinatrema bivittatum]|uniref:shieldin complex subunit 1 isoform X2 n=1 Tax=Rhinatrema bivittatum TaxID=194408 RepID=UPI0011284159|nr:shieldin complex subunit 1 isoform X2 [Rhinatrema bivittatum]
MLADWPLFFLPSLLFLSKHGVPVSLGFRIMGENEPTQGQMSEEYSSFVDFPSSYDLMSILQNQGYNSGLNDSSPAPWCTLVSSGSLTAGSVTQRNVAPTPRIEPEPLAPQLQRHLPTLLFQQLLVKPFVTIQPVPRLSRSKK